MVYRKTEIGYPVIAVFGIAVYILIQGIGNSGKEPFIILLAGILFLFLFLNFFSMTIRIDEDQLSWYFGIGLFRFHVPLDQIRKTSTTRLNLIDGFGIRYRPGRGSVYNVSGFSGIEIQKKDGGVIRLGTEDPVRLVEILQRIT